VVWVPSFTTSTDESRTKLGDIPFDGTVFNVGGRCWSPRCRRRRRLPGRHRRPTAQDLRFRAASASRRRWSPRSTVGRGAAGCQAGPTMPPCARTTRRAMPPICRRRVDQDPAHDHKAPWWKVAEEATETRCGPTAQSCSTTAGVFSASPRGWLGRRGARAGAGHAGAAVGVRLRQASPSRCALRTAGSGSRSTRSPRSTANGRLRSVGIVGKRLTVAEAFAAGFGGGMGVFWPMVHQAMRLKRPASGSRSARFARSPSGGLEVGVPLELFDVIVDSSRSACANPTRFYQLVCERLGVRSGVGVHRRPPRQRGGPTALGMQGDPPDRPMIAGRDAGGHRRRVRRRAEGPSCRLSRGDPSVPSTA
jgi:hypothetical protein